MEEKVFDVEFVGCGRRDLRRRQLNHVGKLGFCSQIVKLSVEIRGVCVGFVSLDQVDFGIVFDMSSKVRGFQRSSNERVEVNVDFWGEWRC